MELLQTYEFKINENTNEVALKYPALKGQVFTMNLTLDNGDLIVGIVKFNSFVKNIYIEFYDTSEVRIQPMLNVASNIDLLFLQGYKLIYNATKQQFEFYRL